MPSVEVGSDLTGPPLMLAAYQRQTLQQNRLTLHEEDIDANGNGDGHDI
jgi:hypothetical protein